VLRNINLAIMRRQILAALLLFICHSLAAAERESMDFSLQLSQADVVLRYDGLDHESNVERIGIEVFDTTDPHLHYGFLAGSSRLTVDSDPLLAGLSLDGYHAGLALRGGVGHNPRLDLLTQYLYQDVKDTSADSEVTVTWHEWRAEMLATLRPVSPLTLVAGLAYVNLDAQLRITGDSARTRNMREETGTEKRLGLELSVQNSGRVGLHIQRGVFDSITLIFARAF
jgi:hypothetical protein